MTDIRHRILATNDCDSICSHGIGTEISLDEYCIVIKFNNGAFIGLECQNGTLVTKFFLESGDETLEVEWNNEKGNFVIR